MGTTSRELKITADYEWQPSRKVLDALMLEIGRDPTGEDYFEDMNRILKSLHGVSVHYELKAQFKWSDEMLSQIGEVGAAQHHENSLLPIIRKADAEIKRTLVQRALDGLVSPGARVDFGAIPVALDAPLR